MALYKWLYFLSYLLTIERQEWPLNGEIARHEIRYPKVAICFLNIEIFYATRKINKFLLILST